MTKLFAFQKSIVCFVTVIEIFFPNSELKNKIETMLQLNFFNSGSWLKQDSNRKQKNVPKNKAELFEDKKKFLFFAWGQEKL